MGLRRPGWPAGRCRSALFVGLVALIGSSGCGIRSANLSPHAAGAAHHGKLTQITYINPLPGDPLWDQVGSCMTAAAARHGITVRIVGPGGGNVNPQVMGNLLAQAVATRSQAIVTWVGGSKATFDPLFAKQRAQGGLVATVKSIGTTKNQTFEIGTPQEEYARTQVRAIARRPGHQYIAVISGRPSPYDAAFRDEVSKHPNVTLLEQRFDYGKFTDDLPLATAMLTAHPQVNALVNYSGFPGILTAIEEKHLVGKVIAYTSSDLPKTTIRYINEGLIGTIRVGQKCLIGDTVVQKFIDAWAGKPIKPRYSDGISLVSGAEFKRRVARGDL